MNNSTDNFLDASYMTSVFNAYGNIINLYSEIVQLFDDNLKTMPEINTALPKNIDRYHILKPKITAFTNSIKNVTIREHIIANLKKIYKPF